MPSANPAALWYFTENPQLGGASMEIRSMQPLFLEGSSHVRSPPGFLQYLKLEELVDGFHGQRRLFLLSITGIKIAETVLDIQKWLAFV